MTANNRIMSHLVKFSLDFGGFVFIETKTPDGDGGIVKRLTLVFPEIFRRQKFWAWMYICA